MRRYRQRSMSATEALVDAVAIVIKSVNVVSPSIELGAAVGARSRIVRSAMDDDIL